MARTTERLTALKVARTKRPGFYPDGRGLYLEVTKGGRSWVLRFMLNGRARWMGLGSAHDITLAEARERAAQARNLRRDGIDPIEQRRAELAARRHAGATTLTFQECAKKFIASHEGSWGNDVHRRQWKNSLAKHVYPVIGDFPVHTIDTPLVLKVLKPIWESIPETAARIRGRIENVLGWATVHHYRTGDNPARWNGLLEHALPARSARIKHLAALPYVDLRGFMATLRGQQGIAAHALEFLILTAGRSGEVMGARWSEINPTEKVWAVPAERMKAGKEHRVPLSEPALDILGEMRASRPAGDADAFVFPGKLGRPLHKKALFKLLRKMGRGDLTTHGFRSSFRDWISERTNFPSEVAEMALAHVVGSKVEAAYRRGDMFEKRRRLMQQWATFCTAAPPEATASNVALIRQTS